jgi:hypothetical protein
MRHKQEVLAECSAFVDFMHFCLLPSGRKPDVFSPQHKVRTVTVLYQRPRDGPLHGGLK